MLFFTNWGLIITIISLIMTIICSNDKQFTQKNHLMAWNHFLFELGLLFEIIISLVYWILIHHHNIARNLEWDNMFHKIIGHSIPMVSMVINFLITDIVLVRDHISFLYKFGLFYIFINYVGFLYKGHPLYPFMMWDSL